jgi:hypothetical protein
VGAEGDTLISALRLSSFEDPSFIQFSFRYRNGTFCSIPVQFERREKQCFGISKTESRLNLVVSEDIYCIKGKLSF